MTTLYSRVKKLAENDADLPLPISEKLLHGSRSFPFRWLTRRVNRAIVIVLTCLALFTCFRVFMHLSDTGPQEEDTPDPLFPPLYSKYHQDELAYPQHNPDLPYPEGREGKYIWMANHVHGSGWGNAMQELLLNSYLAYRAGRSFVFNNYTWNRNGPDYSDYDGKLIPSRIPLSVLMTGPTAGGPFPEGDPAPRAVVKEYWDRVCPNPRVMMSNEVSDSMDPEATALEILNAWIKKLDEITDRCVEIDRESLQLFAIWVFGTERILDIFPVLSKSPIMQGFGWSPLVLSAFDTNRHLFSPPPMLEHYFPFFGSSDLYSPLPGLLALHIRRGDFDGHCHHLAKWASRFNGFNTFPDLPDKFTPHPEGGDGVASEAATAYYLKHCFPSVTQIVEKVRQVRASPTGKGLRNIYVMTNAPKSWILQLKYGLDKLGGWDHIGSSRDLKLSWEQKFIAQSVDMLIGQRADVFIGNGFSSLTSNVVMFRRAKGFAPDTNRFW